ncbi:MAG: GNAT family N-acetyltransferase [Thermoplasmatota archaeon]
MGLVQSVGEAPTVRVVRAHLTDLDAIKRLEDASFPPTQAYSRAEYTDLLGAPFAVNLAAVDAGRLVGYACAVVDELGGTAHIVTLSVDGTTRRRGIGRALITHLEREIKQRGARRVILEVGIVNHAAVALYESVGYNRQRRLRGYYHDDPEPDAWRYAKDLE